MNFYLQDLKAILDSGKDLPFPDGLIINGGNSAVFTVDQGIHKFHSIRLHKLKIIISPTLMFLLQTALLRLIQMITSV